jgi:hypothetical protein
MKLIFAAAIFLLSVMTFRTTAASVVKQGSQAVAGGIVINGHALSPGATLDTGVLKQERRVLPDFRQIDIRNFAGKIHIKFGQENIVFISADSSVVPLIKTKVEGDVLKIGVKKNISTLRPVKLDVQVKSISSISVDGAAEVMIEDIRNVENFNIDVSGAASVAAQGNIEKITAVISEAGKLQCEKLFSEEAFVSVSGSGRATVNAGKKLTAKAFGAGHVVYAGHPVVISETTGAGRVDAAE